jgi:hypothetical protein
MSSDAILDLTAAIVVFGSAIVFANHEKLAATLKKVFPRNSAKPANRTSPNL